MSDENPSEKINSNIDPETIRNIDRLAMTLERMRIADYITYLSKPGYVLKANFMAGLARGLGFGLGITVLFGVAMYILGRMVDLPLIGSYIAKIVAIVHEQVRTLPPSVPPQTP